MSKHSPHTLLTTTRPKIICPARQGPTNVDNIWYWSSLKRVFGEEHAAAKKLRDEERSLSAAFPERDVAARDSSSFAERITSLNSILHEIDQQNGPRYARLHGVFHDCVKSAEIARTYPEIPLKYNTKTFAQYSPPRYSISHLLTAPA